MRFKYLFILFLFFIISVVIRIPNLNRPLSKHHEFNPAFFLIPMEIWNKSSVQAHDYSPVLNYPTDKGINDFCAGDTEKDGNYYYLSFGAVSYLIPYFFLDTFHSINVFGLQIFNVLFHLLSAFLIFRILLLMQQNNKLKSPYFYYPAIIYLLLPNTLWYHGNAYTHHVLGVFFLLLTFYATLLLLKKVTFFTTLLFFSSLVLFINTEWLSCFYAGTLFCYLLVIKHDRKWLILFVLLLSVLAGLTLFFAQYSSLIGTEKLLEYLHNRFMTRSFFDKGLAHFFTLFYQLGFWYLVGFVPLLTVLLFVGFTSMKSYYNTKRYHIFFLLFVPIFLYHIVFSEFTIAHEYSVMYDTVYFSLLAGVFIIKSNRFLEEKRNTFHFLLFTLFAFSIGQYYVINRPGVKSQNGDLYINQKRVGLFIKKHAAKDEVIIVQNLADRPNPQVVFYAKRNFYSVYSTTEKNKLIKSLTAKKYFFLELNHYTIVHFAHLKKL